MITCKGRNRNEDTIGAIRNILAQQYKLKVVQVDDKMIYNCLLKIVRKYADVSEVNRLLDELFELSNTITIIDAIVSLIVVIANIIVFDDNEDEIIHLEENEAVLNWVEN